MSLTKCPYCVHGNPANAKFCNACGATLTLAPCPHCGAVNEVSAKACYQCRGPLPAALGGEPALALPVAEVSAPSALRSPRVIGATVVVAAVAAFGYFAYRPRSVVEVPPASPAAAAAVRPAVEANLRAGPVDAGAVARDAAAGKSEPAKAEAAKTESTAGTAVSIPPSARPASVEASPPSAAQPTPPASQRRAGRRSAEPPAVAAGAALPPISNIGKAGELEPPRLGPCTDRVAALGLCTLKPAAKREAEPDSAAGPAATRPPAASAGKATEQPCTEAVVALGLCTLKPIQRRE